MTKIYLSPSKQPRNIYFDKKHTEEQVMNLVTDALVNFLKDYKVDIIRGGKTTSIENRIAEANKIAPDYYLSLHSNAGGGLGCETYYQVGLNHSKDVKTKSRSYAGKLNWDFSQITPTNTREGDRGIKYKRWGVNDWNMELRGVNAPANLIEIEFHDTIAGGKWILANIQKIGETIGKSLVEIFHLELKPVEPPIPADDYYFVQTAAFKTLAEAEAEAKMLAKNLGREIGVKYGSKHALKWIKGIK